MTDKIPLVEEFARTPRYAIRKGAVYLATPPGGQDLQFSSTTIADAVKFASAEDAERLIEHLFDVDFPQKWDAAQSKQVPDPDAPPHLGKFRGQDKSDLQIVATHT
jgi:hypothetical protein